MKNSAFIKLENVLEGTKIRIEHDLNEYNKKEYVCGEEYTVTWRGPDVIKVDPQGEHLRLYQRQAGIEKYLPTQDECVRMGTEVLKGSVTNQSRKEIVTGHSLGKKSVAKK